MSRTFRRKSEKRQNWYSCFYSFVSDYVRVEGTWIWTRVYFAKDSKEYARGVAKYHSDAGTTNFKEPGPSWFRNKFNTKPSRAGARNEINKWLRNEDYEVIAETHPHLPYWT